MNRTEYQNIVIKLFLLTKTFFPEKKRFFFTITSENNAFLIKYFDSLTFKRIKFNEFMSHF